MSKARPWLVLLAVLCLLPGKALADQPSDAEMKSVYLVFVTDGTDAGSGFGTGWVVAPGKMVTAAHVVEGATQIRVIPPLGDPQADGRVAKLLWIDREGDMAMIGVDNLQSDAKPLPITLSPASKGEHVYAVGYPKESFEFQAQNRKIDNVLTSGNISSIFGMSWSTGARQVRLLQHGAEITHGNSGGPLFDGCGRVIGINTAGPKEGPVKMFLASDIAEFKKAIDATGPHVDFTLSDAACGKDEKLAAVTSPTPSPSTQTVPPPQSGSGIPTWLYAVIGVFLLSGLAFLARVIVGRRARPEPPGETLMLSPIADGRPFGLDPDLLARRQGLVIGRMSSFCDAQVGGEEVSRRHVRLRSIDGVIQVEDLNSSSGTFVGSFRLSPFTPHPLGVGDLLRLGNQGLRLSVDPARTAPAVKAGAYRTVLIGRHADCDLEIPSDASVGRRHAELTLAGNDALLTDRCSTSGTTVKRGDAWQPVTNLLLTRDMRLRFGKFEIVAGQLIDTARAPAAEPATPRDRAPAGILRRNPDDGSLVGM